MSNPALAEDRFEGFAFPVWVAVHTGVEMSESFATHFLVCDDGDKELPLFFSEANAVEYIAHRTLTEYEPRPIHDAEDLLIRLELFRKRGGTHVRLDDTTGPTIGAFCPELDSFSDHVRSHIQR